jgi:outer membrane protein OmpA-like peptidoglycan-associated protein
VQAEGVGYLSPRASNLTDEGRATNRRVEVMLVNTE